LPLVNGLSDAFRQRNWPIVGPSKQAARLEGSKIFSKEFLVRHKIPTANMYGAYDSAPDACDALSSVDWPLVIKADGLCAGKGVFLAPDQSAAQDFIVRVMEKEELGAGGKRILLEEALEGDELSFMILTDGERYARLAPTRDHKRVFDGDKGPNTGGMGAYSTDDLLPGELRRTILTKILEPTLRGLAADGIRYQGFLYIGLMVTKWGPMVLEFNCRLGDPETQAIIARMDFDLAEVLRDAAVGKLEPSMLRWQPGASVCVVLTSGGYPGKFAIGKPIGGLTSLGKQSGVVVFHAATKLHGSQIVSNGGRVLGVIATGPSLDGALAKVYSVAAKIHFEGMHYRRDIGGRNSRLIAAGD
jgi:phosphoribosylamine---glycine ligase